MNITVPYCVCVRYSPVHSMNSALINNSETSWVEEFCCSKEQQTFTKQKEKHGRKFRHLLSKRSPVHSGLSLKDKWVMNLSSEELSALERNGVEKGLKFAIAPRKMPTAEIIAAVEESISQFNDDLYSGVLNLLPKTFKRMFSMRLYLLKRIRTGSYYLLKRVTMLCLWTNSNITSKLCICLMRKVRMQS